MFDSINIARFYEKSNQNRKKNVVSFKKYRKTCSITARYADKRPVDEEPKSRIEIRNFRTAPASVQELRIGR